ncbi:MAG: hypothetical protein R3220_02970 [Balneolaceae bacterium]|nr:hypothetical protein [Balneolaceae bacterium]
MKIYSAMKLNMDEWIPQWTDKDGDPEAFREAPHEAISIAGVHHFEVAYNRVYRSYKEGIDLQRIEKYNPQ